MVLTAFTVTTLSFTATTTSTFTVRAAPVVHTTIVTSATPISATSTTASDPNRFHCESVLVGVIQKYDLKRHQLAGCQKTGKHEKHHFFPKHFFEDLKKRHMKLHVTNIFIISIKQGKSHILGLLCNK